MVLVLMFGPQRKIVKQQYLSATAGSVVETELFDVAQLSSPSVEIVTQLQYTQRTLFKAEVLTDSGTVLSTVSQDFSSRQSESSKKLSIPNWPDPQAIKVKLSVASQNITAAPPQGITAAEVPVIFQINLYRQWLNRAYLWPALWGCIGLLIIVTLADKKSQTNSADSWT